MYTISSRPCSARTEASGKVTRRQTRSPSGLSELSCQARAHAGPAAAFLPPNLLIKLLMLLSQGLIFKERKFLVCDYAEAI